MSTEQAQKFNNLFEKLTENMQVIYRKAIDADDSLAKLQQTGKGKFNYIFTEEAGFTIQSKRFMPYVKELAQEVAELEGIGQEKLQMRLPDIVKKMEMLLTTLSQFKVTL